MFIYIYIYSLLMQMTDVNRHIGEAELFTPGVIGLQHIKCLLLEQVCIWCHFIYIICITTYYVGPTTAHHCLLVAMPLTN